MSWLGGWFDPELEELFRDEPELLDTARRVRAARPDAEADPRFRNRLRAQLVAEAAHGRSRSARRWWRLQPVHAAWGGAAVGAVLIGATVVTFLSTHPADKTIVAFSNVAAQHAVLTDNVITVAFNQPMDKQAVESGVRIQPATKVKYSWSGDKLVITPVYHLTGNTPYTVSIAQSAIRTASGAVATAPIVIPFATAPTPPAGSGSTTPALVPSTLGANGSGGSVLFAPDGSVVSTAGIAPDTGTPATAGAPPSPSAGSTPAPEGVITQSPALTGSLVDYPPAGAAVLLGPSPSAAAFSPNGRTLGMAIDDGNGGSRIVVTLADGTQRSFLGRSSTPVTALTWSSNDRIVYTTGTTIGAVDLSRRNTTLYTVPDSGNITLLAPGGAYAFITEGSGADGVLLDIAAGSDQTLHGSVADVAFSGDGSTVAWVDESGGQSHLMVQPVDRNTPASVSIIDPAATLDGITLDADGGEAAYLSTGADGSTQLVVAQLPSGAPLAIGMPANPSALALSSAGDQVAYLSNGASGPEVDLAAVPGASAVHTPDQVPAAANSTLHAFVEAQVRGDNATLAALSGPGVDAASGTPRQLSRAYVISTYLGAQGLISASVELIVDPDAGHASAKVASETLTLARSDTGGYVVTTLDSTPLRAEASGPHVVQVRSSTENGVTTLQVSFDSDLDPATVAEAISVMASGSPLQSTAVYDPNSRTATVTIEQAPSGPLTLVISTALGDVNGQPLARAFQTAVGTGSQ